MLYMLVSILSATFSLNSLDKAFLYLACLLSADPTGRGWALTLAELLLCGKALDFMHVDSLNPLSLEKWAFFFHVYCFEREETAGPRT